MKRDEVKGKGIPWCWGWYTMDLQTRIRDLIEDRDMTQRKIAKVLGITESAMSGYLTGKVWLPAWLVQACAEYFQVSTDYLYGLTNDPQQKIDLSPAERDLVFSFRTLTRDQRELIVRSVAIMREQNGT